MKRMYDFVCENGHKIERYCVYEMQAVRISDQYPLEMVPHPLPITLESVIGQISSTYLRNHSIDI